MRTAAFLFLSLLAPAHAAVAFAQTALDEARAQYEAAAYEDALVTLRKADEAAPPAERVQIEQYRALCLIALGQMADAERAVAALVAADPTYVPAPTIASPKVVSLVNDIRKRQLPRVARALLDAGRTAFNAKDFPRAEHYFTLLLTVLDDEAMRGLQETPDLRTLAEGFATLTKAARATPPAPAPTAPADNARAEPGRNGTPAAAPASAVPETNGSAPEANGTARETNGSTSPDPDEFFVPAVAIEQTLPEWVPPSQSVARFEYEGRLRVRVGTDGKVKDVEIEKPSHPSYDARLLEVARTWTYRPATRHGVPVESDRIIAIRLRAEP
jgi:protein TonB